jgi:hypothetical protein
MPDHLSDFHNSGLPGEDIENTSPKDDSHSQTVNDYLLDFHSPDLPSADIDRSIDAPIKTQDDLDYYRDYVDGEGDREVSTYSGMDRDDFEELVSEEQGTMNKIGSGVVRLGTGILTKAAQGVGFTGGLVLGALNPNNWNDEFLSNAIADGTNNAFSEMFEEAEEGIKKHLAPVHESAAYKNGDWLEQMGTPEFWAADFADGLAFGISSWLTGYGISKLGMQTFANIGAAKTAKFLPGVDDVAKLSQRYGKLGAAGIMTTGEALFEAKEVRDQLINDGVSPEIAAEKARDAFLLNMAVLAPSNIIEAGYLFKAMKPGGVSKAVSGIGKKAGKWVDETVDYKGFKKFMDSRPGAVLKASAVSYASEGAYEENAQLAISNLMSEYGEGKKVGNVVDAFFDMPGEMLDNFGTNEGKKSMVLGWLVGTGLTSTGAIREKNEERAKREAMVESMNNADASWIDKGGLYKTTVVKNAAVRNEVYPTGAEKYGKVEFEDGSTKEYDNKEQFEKAVNEGVETEKYVLDVNGNPVFDEAKINERKAEAQRAAGLDHLIDAAYKNKDWATYRILRGEKFKNLVAAYHNAGKMDEFYKQLESYRGMEKEALEGLGYEYLEADEYAGTKTADEIINDYIEDAREIEKKFDLIDKSVVNTTFRKKTIDGKEITPEQITQRRKNELKNFAARDYYVQKEIDTAQNKVDEIVNSGRRSPILSQYDILKTAEATAEEALKNAEIKGNQTEIDNKKEVHKAAKKELEEFEKDYMEDVEDEQSRLMRNREGDLVEIDDALSLEELSIEELKVAELTNAKKEIQTHFKGLIDPVKGNKYFIDNNKAIAQTYTNSILYDMPIDKLLKTNTKEYLEYEKSKLKTARIQNLIDKIKKNIFNKALRERLATGEDLIDVLRDIIDIKPPLNDASKRLLESNINRALVNIENQIKQEVKVIEDQLEAAKKEKLAYEQDMANMAMGMGAPVIPDWWPGGQDDITGYQEHLTDKVTDLQQELKEAVNSPENVTREKVADSIKNYYKQIQDSNYYKDVDINKDNEDVESAKKIARVFFRNRVKGILQNYNLNDNYDNLAEVDVALGILRKLETVFNEREDTKEFKDIKQEIADNIKDLVEIQAEIIKKLEDRKSKQLEIWRNHRDVTYNALGYSINEAGELVADSDYEEFHKHIARVVPKFKELMENAKKDNYSYIYGEIINQYLRDIGQENEKEAEILVDIIDSIQKVKSEKIQNNKRWKESYISDIVMNAYLNNPDRAVNELLMSLSDNTSQGAKYDSTKESSLYKYNQDKDLIAFVRNIKEETVTKPDLDNYPIGTPDANKVSTRQDIYDFVLLHQEYSGVRALARNTKGEFSYPSQLIAELEAIKRDPKTPAPTAQQVIAIRQLINFLYEPVVDKAYSGWSYLKGFAGTGKTNVTLRWAMSTLGVTDRKSEIYAFGHTKSSSKTVRDSINSNPEASYNQLTKGGIPATTKLIVIDEVGAFNEAQLIKIAEVVQEANKSRTAENKLKVITLGDPNQRTTEIHSSRATIDILKQLPGSHRIRALQPLTVRYRSNVGPIINFQDKFMDQSVDLRTGEDQLVFSNTADPAAETAEYELLGVYGTNDFDNKVIEVLKARQGAKNKDGETVTKAIIVNQNQVKVWTDKLASYGITDVEVLSPYTAQGRTIDEIYVNINKIEEEHGKGDASIKKYNTDLYTSYSRATKFIYTGNIPTQNALDPALGEDSTTKLEEVSERKAEYLDQLEKDLIVFKDNWIGEIETPSAAVPPSTGTTTKENVNPEGPEILENEEQDEGAIIPTGGGVGTVTPKDDNLPPGSPSPPAPLPLKPGEEEHKLQNPSNLSLKTVKTDKTYDPIVPGDEIEYVLGKYNDEPTVMIVKREDDNTFREIGVLGQDEADVLPDNISKAVKEAVANAKAKDNWVIFNKDHKTGMLTTMEPVIPIVSGKISNATGLNYVYDSKKRNILTKEILKDIAKKFKQVFFNDSEYDTPYDIRIFGTKTAKEMNDGHGLNIEPGIPYIYFSNPLHKKAKKGSAKPQVIRLAPRKLNKNYHNEEYFAPINAFIEDGKILEKMIEGPMAKIGNHMFHKLIHALVKNRTDEAQAILTDMGLDPALVKDPKVLEQAKIVYEHVYIDDNNREPKINDKMRTKEGLEPKFKTKTGKNKKVAIGATKIQGGELYVQAKGDKQWIPWSEMELANKALSGPAQKAMNKLAKSNLMIDDRVIRVHVDANDPKRPGEKITQSRGLLSTTDNTTVKLFSTESGQEYLYRKASRIVKASGKTGSAEFKKAVKEIVDNPTKEDITALQGTLSIEALEKMMAVDAEGNSTASGGFGARTPIPMINTDLNLTGQDMKEFELAPDADTNIRQDTEKLGIDYLSKYFETTFQRIDPTNIIIALDPASVATGITAPTTVSTTTSTVTPGKKKRKSTRTKKNPGMKSLKERTLDPGKKVSLDKAMALFKKIIPSATPEQLQVVSNSAMLLMTEGEEAWGRWHNGVIYVTAEGLTDKTILHEVFHEIFNRHLSHKERQAMLRAARQYWGNLSELELEERLAESFQEEDPTFLGRLTRAALRILSKIANWLGFYSDHQRTIDKLFRDILRGKYSSEPSFEFGSEGRNRLVISRDYGSVDLYHNTKIIFNTALHNVLEEQQQPIEVDELGNPIYTPMTKIEMFQEMAKNLYEDYQEVKQEVNEAKEAGEEIDPEDAMDLESYKKLLDPKLFADLIRETYPSMRIKAGKTLNTLTEDDLENKTDGEQEAELEGQEDLNDDGVSNFYKEFIEEGDQINHEKKITQSVKDLLNFVFYKVGDESIRVNPRYAFVVLAQRLQGIDFSNREAALSQLTEAFKDTDKPSDIAIYKKVEALINLSELDRWATDEVVKEDKEGNKIFKFRTLPNNIEFTDENTLKWINKEGVVRFVNRQKVKGKLESTEEFFKRIYNFLPEESRDYNMIKGLFLRSEAGNSMSELVTALGSLRTKQVKLGMKIWRQYEVEAGTPEDPFATKEKKKVEYRYISQDENGFRDVAYAKVLDSIDKNFADSTNFKALKAMLNKVSKDKNQKTKDVKKLLVGMDILKPSDSISMSAADTIFTDLEKMVKSWEVLSKEEFEILDENNNVLVDDKGNKQVEYGDINLLILDSNDRIDRMVDAMIENTEEFGDASYIAGDGKPRYKLMNSSQAFDTLRTFMKDYLTKPKYFTNEFYSKNPFISNTINKGKGKIKGLENHKIYGYLDHDSMKEKDSTYDPITYKNEKPKDWLERNLSYMFTSMLSTSPKGKLKYAQQFWTPSNKPNIFAGEVDLLTDGKVSQVKAAIRAAIEQEAYRPEAKGLFGVQYFSKNRGKSSLVGLDKAFTVGQLKQKKVLDNAIEKVYAALEKHTEEVLDAIELNKIRLSSDQVSRIYSKYKYVFNPKFQDKLDYETYTNEMESEYFENAANNREALRPIVDLFVKNFCLNGHFLTQVVTGDVSFFKSAGAAIKRMSVAFAQGQHGRVHPKYGMQEKFSMAVAKDLQGILGEEYDNFLAIVGQDYEIADAQGFMTVGRYEDLKKGFGKASGLAYTMKPVHYEIDDFGIPRAVKYSQIVLTRQLVERFPRLAKLRDAMEEQERRTGNYMEFVFHSGFKVGAPDTKATIDRATGDVTIPEDSVIELSNRNYRIQQQPYHDVTAQSVAYPTQLFYFLNSNGKNYDQANVMYEKLATIFSTGEKLLEKSLGLTGDSAKTIGNLKNMIINALEKRDSSSDRALDFLLHKKTVDGKKVDAISMNVPFLVNKFVSTFMSETTKRTVKAKLPGAKLVLQSPIQAEEYLVDKDGNKLPAPKWRNERGYAEVYLPEEFAEQVSIGDKIMYSKTFGFRVPSTELHSAIPIEVIGFYPTSSRNENIMIVPEEITFFHGSDYDIDALYVMAREKLDPKKGIDIGSVQLPAGATVGYDKEGNWKGDKLLEDIEATLKLLEDNILKEKEQDKKKDLLAKEKTLLELKQQVLKNGIIEDFLEIITAERNLKDMMSPISLRRFKGENSAEGLDESVWDMISRVFKIKNRDELLGKRNLNLVLDQMLMHKDNFSGVNLTGIFANQAKGLFYIWQAARLTSNDSNAKPLLHKNMIMKIGEAIYNNLSLTERLWKEGAWVDNKLKLNNAPLSTGETVLYEDTPTVNETMDMMINAAIDNVNEQVLPVINVTDITSDSFVGFAAVGMPLVDNVRLMLQPAAQLLNFSNNFRNGYIDVKEILNKGVEEEIKDSEISKIELSQEMLERNMRTFESTTQFLKDMTREQRIEQLAVLKYLWKANAIGKGITGASAAVRQIQDLGTSYSALVDGIQKVHDYHGVLSYEQAMTALENDKTRVARETEEEGEEKDQRNMAFTNANLLTLPHVKAAYNIAINTRERLNKLFPLHHPLLVQMSENIRTNTNLRLDQNDFRTEEMIREEFIKYLINSLSFETEGAGLIDFSTSGTKPVVWENSNGRKGVAYGIEAWNYNFINKVKQLKKDNPNNLFLKYIIPKGKMGRGAGPYLSFKNTKNFDERDIALVQEAFLDLNEYEGEYNELQYDFLKYAAINQGFSFGSMNYTSILPESIYDEVFGALDNKINSIKNVAEEEMWGKLNKLSNHFAIQLALNNMQHVRQLNRNKGVATNQKIKLESGTEFYDLFVYEKEIKDTDSEVEEDITDKYPDMIKYFDTLYVKIRPDMTINVKEGQRQGSGYMKVGKQKGSNVYNWNDNVELNGYSYQTAFSSDKYTIFVSNPNTLSKVELKDNKWTYVEGDGINYSESKYRPKLSVGDVIRAVTKDDSLRDNAVYYKVENVDTRNDKNHYKLQKITLMNMLDKDENSEEDECIPTN